jgi:hypothetical protein
MPRKIVTCSGKSNLVESQCASNPARIFALQFHTGASVGLQDAISRVQTLEEEGRITGVMDDRGKFIYISREEMAAVADYVKSRGRVAIGELAAKSNTFIDLEQKCGLSRHLMEESHLAIYRGPQCCL